MLNLDLALSAANAASEAILEIYSGEIDIENKSDGSPVTQADIAAHNEILSTLSSGPFPVLSEEGVVTYEERKSWESFWLVDPLDGTKDFIARNGDFTVNIALIENGQPTVGVIAAPARQTIWLTDGKHAWKEQNGKRTSISANAPWPEKPRATVSRFHDNEGTLECCQLNMWDERVPAGSALKFAMVAESSAEAYPRFNGSWEWDIAAGHALLSASGAEILSDQGEKLVYNKPNLLNPFFIAWRKPLEWSQVRLPGDEKNAD